MEKFLEGKLGDTGGDLVDTCSYVSPIAEEPATSLLKSPGRAHSHELPGQSIGSTVSPIKDSVETEVYCT